MIITITDAATENDEHAESLNWQVEDLFDACSINMAPYEDAQFGIADGDDLIAALVSGSPYEDNPWLGMRFSVCVSPDHRRQGHGKRLVEEFIAYCETNGFQPEAHVVNDEAMNPMLEDLGFSAEGPIWTY